MAGGGAVCARARMHVHLTELVSFESVLVQTQVYIHLYIFRFPVDIRTSSRKCAGSFTACEFMPIKNENDELVVFTDTVAMAWVFHPESIYRPFSPPD